MSEEAAAAAAAASARQITRARAPVSLTASKVAGSVPGRVPAATVWFWRTDRI